MITTSRHEHTKLALLLSLLALLLFASWLGGAKQPAPKPREIRSPLTPKQALAEFRLAPGLRIELVACEPQIESPVAMAFDEDGRLWVVEMRDYPNGPPPGKPPQGRIRILEDRDGDGFYEHSTVFADGLLFANGLMPWKGGVIVTAAPHIVYLKDTKGSGKADKREVLYEGFAAQNPQLRVSHPILGVDNWVYVANGLRGGQAKRAGQADAKPINLSGMDFRFDLIRDRAEAISGLGQFGNTFDDWGRRFVCDNRHHLRHIVIDNRYLKRNPYLAAPAVVEDISVLEDGPLSSGGKVYPISKNWTTSSLHVGRFTAACGVLIYRGDLLPKAFHGSAFTCEPTGNLVHQEVLRQHGATFRSEPPRKGVEFLASPDDWFRPVFLTHGPDGALYVVDMYRAVIEHPEFMPPELKNRPDLTLGKDRGRIWRIVPEKHQTKPIRPSLSKATTAELVGLLEHPEGWWRTTAQRLLLQRQDRAAVEPLRKLTLSSAQPLARLHAAWLLERLGGLDETLLLALLQDPHPRQREHGVRLAEPWIGKDVALRKGVFRLARDADPQVRFQVGLSLGEWDNDQIVPGLAAVALLGAEDRWTRLAVASAVPNRAGDLLRATLPPVGGPRPEITPGRFLLLQELAALVGARRDQNEVVGVLQVLQRLRLQDQARWQLAGLNGLAEGMGRRGTQLAAFLKALPADRRPIAEQTEALLARAAKLTRDAALPLEDRLAAVRLLAHTPWEIAGPALKELLAPDHAQEIRLAAVRALAAQPRPEVAGELLKSWRAYTPALRREVTEALLRQPDRIRTLLKEVEAGRVRPGDIDALRTRQLVNHSNTEIRERSRTLLRDNLPADRKKVLADYRPALTLKGDPQRGREVFRKNCATCHKVADIGVDVGPDIADTRTKTLDALLVDILNPNQAIDSNYVNYLIVTKNGKTLTGLIATETAGSVTLRRAENQTETVLRQDIESIQSTGVSLMPEGLEKTITIQEMADLLHFLKNWRYLDGSVPLK
ncbi:MAG TPA: PVC-type heme-binding CxxCH protein [Gemmataceae bacterium]|nr:PVC-type heme-binding CxxCH protein [Gemmataceae bacterium]